MPIRGVVFSLSRPPVRIEVDSPGKLRAAAGKKHLPVALVMSTEDLSLLAQCAELFVNRRQKDTRKGLSRILLGQHDRIPYLYAPFTSEGRMRQSVEVLLRNSEKSAAHGIYILGVDGRLFAKVWKGALECEALTPKVRARTELSSLLPELPGEEWVSQRFWGESEACHLVRQLILRAAPIDDPVLILGETGTGKGVAANAIHELGRPGKPFVTVNCAAIPDDLFESEVFGYEPGSFSGALKTGKVGLWELARDGTLFLDEIGDLRLDHQTKILHTLQTGIIRRLGGVRDTRVSARVIAATNRNLYSMVQTGRFRDDLYYRLRQFVIITPDLRDDPHNLMLIAQQLWHEITRTDVQLPKEILEELVRHRWPGNIRELRSVLSSLNNFFGTGDLRREHLSAVFQHFGLVAGYGQRRPGAGERGTPQLECLKNLRRADDAIRACEQVLKPVADGRTLSPQLRDSLTRIRVEMRTLLRNRLCFGSPETWRAVSRVEEDLGRMLDLPMDDGRATARFQRTMLAPDIDRAVSRLFDENQRMLDSKV